MRFAHRKRFRLALSIESAEIRAIASQSGKIIVAAVLAIVACGCGSEPEYPTHLSFPSRMDRLVLKIPESVPPGPNSAGQLDAELAEIDVRGGRTREPGSLSIDLRSELDRILRASFGTPSAPTIRGPESAKVGKPLEELGLSDESLAEGSKLFRKHCQGCHGLPGDGRGPAGLFLHPYPRDFRQGAFKFVSSGAGMKPRRADLFRTLAEGIKGTAMPSFSLLPERERDDLSRYAIYLAIRGEVEFQTLAALDSLNDKAEVATFAAAGLRRVLKDWGLAQGAAPLPKAPDDGEPMTDAYSAAVRRGYELFIAKTDTECLKCHGDFGRKPLLRYDVWGTVARPANFAVSQFKGGSRPEDVYARIRFGIAPVGMPEHPKLTDRQVWDLVAFVRSAPYPRELPKDVRDIVYPNP